MEPQLQGCAFENLGWVHQPGRRAGALPRPTRLHIAVADRIVLLVGVIMGQWRRHSRRRIAELVGPAPAHPMIGDAAGIAEDLKAIGKKGSPSRREKWDIGLEKGR